jgi:hypothetical protein
MADGDVSPTHKGWLVILCARMMDTSTQIHFPTRDFRLSNETVADSPFICSHFHVRRYLQREGRVKPVGGKSKQKKGKSVFTSCLSCVSLFFSPGEIHVEIHHLINRSMVLSSPTTYLISQTSSILCLACGTSGANSTMIKDMMDKQVLELRKLWANKRQLMFQLLNLAMIVFSALMIWKGLMFATKVRSLSD